MISLQRSQAIRPRWQAGMSRDATPDEGVVQNATDNDDVCRTDPASSSLSLRARRVFQVADSGHVSHRAAPRDAHDRRHRLRDSGPPPRQIDIRQGCLSV